MKSKIFLFMLTLLIIVNVNTANAAEFKRGSEPNGFRRIKWGTDLSLLPEMVQIKHKDILLGPRLISRKYLKTIIYERKNDDLVIGGVKFKEIHYYCLKDTRELYQIFAITESGMSSEDWEKLKGFFVKMYGPNTQKDTGWDFACEWEGKHSIVRLYINKHHKHIVIEFAHKINIPLPPPVLYQKADDR